MKCMKVFKRCDQNNYKKWRVYIFFGCFSLILAIVLSVLVGVKTIEWNWLTGYVLGLLAVIISLVILRYSISKLLRDENYFLYYFFYTLRVGIYVAPFLLAFLISMSFSWAGILIGLIPLTFLPFLKSYWLKNKKSKEKELN